MNQTLENATAVATFVGGISGLWYLGEQISRLSRRRARTKRGPDTARVEKGYRGAILLTSIFSLGLGGASYVFFASYSNSLSWTIAYVSVSAIAGLVFSYWTDGPEASAPWLRLKRIGWALSGTIMAAFFAIGASTVLLPESSTTQAIVDSVVDHQHRPPIALPPYIAPLIGTICGIVGGFYGPMGSKARRLGLFYMFAQAIVASVGLEFTLSASVSAYSLHQPVFALFMLFCTISLMYMPFSLRDLGE
jgi:hypothetical protein